MRHLFTCGPKNDVIHVNVNNGFISIFLFDKEDLVYTPPIKMVVKKESSEPLIPGSRSLLKAIKCLLGPIYIVG